MNTQEIDYEATSTGLTDEQVVAGAERMARLMLKSQGFAFSGKSVRDSINPRAVAAWQLVTAMLDAYNGTDLVSAVDSIAPDDSIFDEPVDPQSPIAEFERKVAAALEAAKGLKVLFVTSLTDYSKHNAVYHSRSHQEATIVGAGIDPRRELDWVEASLPFLQIRFDDGAEIPVFCEELFSHDARFFALSSAVASGYGLAREIAPDIDGPYDLEASGGAEEKAKYVKLLSELAPATHCEQAPWTPASFRVTVQQ